MSQSVDQPLPPPEPVGTVAVEPPGAIPQVEKKAMLSAASESSLLYPRVGLIGLLIVYLGLAVAFSQVIPFNKGPDEGINLDYIIFLAGRGRLPVTYEERTEIGPKGNWPALYHLSVAGLSRLLKVDVTGPPQIKIFWDSFRYRAIDIDDENPWYVLTEDQTWPYYGRILSLHLGRWLSVFFSLCTLPLVYLITLEFLPHRPWLALTATAFLAFIPVFIFVGSVLNEDALVALLAALYLWLLLRIIKRPHNLWLYAATGLVLGLSITVKYTTIVLPLEISIVLLIIARYYGYGWPWWGLRLLVTGGSALLASSWWFGWNLWYLNEVRELGWISGLLRPIFTGGTDVTMARMGNFLSGGQIGLTSLPEDTRVGTFPEWISTTFLSFWGVRIGDTFPFSPYAYLVIGLILAAALVGLWRLWRADSPSRKWLLLLAFHIALFVILPLIRFGLSRRLGQTAQGRHILIPAAVAVVVLLVWGLATVIPLRWQRWLFPLLIAGALGWTGAHLYQLDTFAAAPLPMRTLPQAAEWLPQPAPVQFGEVAELVSYELEPQPAQGHLRLTLAWRSLAYAKENYLLQVSLRNDRAEVVSHWTGYSGQGRLPSLAWDPGDSVFDRLALPLHDLPGGDYRLQIQLVSSYNNAPLEGIATLPVVLAESAGSPAAPTEVLADVTYRLWSADGPVTDALPTFRYPATIAIVTDEPAAVELLDPTGQVWTPTSAQANIYIFVIGPRWPSGDYKLQLTAGSDTVTSEPILQVVNWWPRHFETPEEIAVPMQANLADQLNFLGYTLPQSRVKAGEAFPLTLYWQAPPNHPPQADFIQFNHLLDSTGTLRGGYDRRPLEYYSTLLWAPGEIVTDGYTVPVDADAPPGQYYLSVGYYLTVGESAVNLPLVVDEQMTDQTGITIGPIEVVAP